MTALKKETHDTAAIPETEIRAVLEQMLASNLFNNSPRMIRLLRFLVEKAITGTARDTNEHVIGIEVFDRDSSYSPCEDPIVRVQIGRLRKKLEVHYASPDVGSDIEISIPIGSYMPIIRRINVADKASKQGSMLAIHSFKCISQHAEGASFTQGLEEEIKHRLFKGFGKTIIPLSFLMPGNAGNETGGVKQLSGVNVNHLLEGSVQVDTNRIRASIRLVDVSAGCIAWSEQFDSNNAFTIAHQEELALSICCALKRFF